MCVLVYSAGSPYESHVRLKKKVANESPKYLFMIIKAMNLEKETEFEKKPVEI